MGNSSMKLLVLGAGAVGLSLAARLSPFCEVHALCRAQHAAAIAQQGFQRFDYCLVTAKSQQTRALCEQYHQVLEDAEVVSLQNGIGNEEILAEYSKRVIGGTIITGFEWRGPAQVHVTVEAGPIRLGRFPSGLDSGVERLVELFRLAGLSVQASEFIRTDLWAKTLYNCALNPLGAILDVPYGRLADRHSWMLIQRVIDEAFEVCRVKGIPLRWESAADYLQYLETVQLPATADHHSSMLQDIQKGRETEIDFLNGAIVRLGEQQGIATPINQALVELIRFKTGRGYG